MQERVKKAVKILKGGGIIIFPTDTAFGIGCRVDDEKAVEKLFKIRKRPAEKATPVLVDTVKMAQDFLKPIPQEVIDKLIEPYWPGALTIILYCNKVKVPRLVRGGGNTLGVRIPNHPIARTLIRETGVPILGPSANFYGEKTPYSFDSINKELIKLVDYVVPGDCSVKQASTVIDCSVTPWKILREGAVRIQNSINNITFSIDTSSNQEIRVALKIDGKEFEKKEKIGREKAQVVLPMIDQLLKEHKLKLSDINSIEVNTGPGSFTGLRVGASIANALAFSLKIPVNNKKIGEFVTPTYE